MHSRYSVHTVRSLGLPEALWFVSATGAGGGEGLFFRHLPPHLTMYYGAGLRGFLIDCFFTQHRDMFILT